MFYLKLEYVSSFISIFLVKDFTKIEFKRSKQLLIAFSVFKTCEELKFV